MAPEQAAAPETPLRDCAGMETAHAGDEKEATRNTGYELVGRHRPGTGNC